MNAGSTESNDTRRLTATSGAVRSSGASLPGSSGRSRFTRGALWSFTRHLVEMLIAMFAGMGVFGAAIVLLGEPPGYGNLLIKYGLMGLSMVVPMVGWMRYRGHPWSDGLEMSLAMLAPMLVPVIPVEMGMDVPGLTEESLMMISHVAMISGMVALMLYRWDRYAGRAHGHHS